MSDPRSERDAEQRPAGPPAPPGAEFLQAATAYVTEVVRASLVFATASAEAFGALLAPRRPSSPAPAATSSDAIPDVAAAAAAGESTAEATELIDAVEATRPATETTRPATETTRPATEPAADADADDDSAADADSDAAAADEDAVTAEESAAVLGDLAEVDESPPEQPPVVGWDQLTLGSIRARMSRLEETQLVALHAWEHAHAGRPKILSMLENRIAKVRLAARQD